MARLGGDEVTALTARPITAVPITARPITARRIGEGDGPSVRTLLSIALQSTLVPGIATGSGTPTYTRSTVATVTDFEGLVKNVLSGEARFMGARRVRNLWAYSSENFTGGGAPYLYGSATVSGRVVTATSTSAYGYMSTIYDLTVVPGTELVLSITTSGGTATGVTCAVRDQTNGAFIFEDMPITIGARSSRRFTVPSGCTLLRMYNFRGVVGTGTIEFVNVQLENVTGNANKNPSEYVSVGVLSAPYHGANVDGVKYFTTKNGNTVSSNIVTEATGAAIGASDYFADASGPFGYVAEGARTNLCLWGRDFSNAAWVKTNATAAKDATGRDGVATSASTLTATASNGTCRQTVTSASATRTISCDIKRKTGTGTIEMTVDGGSTYTDITSQINGSTWTRVQVIQAAVTNPSVGFRIGTSGDAIYVDYFGLESASFASSRIHTTTAAVTRNADFLTYDDAGNIEDAAGSAAAEASTFWDTAPLSHYIIGRDSGGRILYLNPADPSNKIRSYDGTEISHSEYGIHMSVSPRPVATTWGAELTVYINGVPDSVPNNYDGSFGSGIIGIGSRNDGTNTFNGTIRNVVIKNVESL